MSESKNTKYKVASSTLLQLGETPNSIYISASTGTSLINQDVTIIVTVNDGNDVGISGLIVELSNTTSTMTDNNDGTYTFLVTSDVNNLITYTVTIVDSDLTTDINVQYVGPATSIDITSYPTTALSNQDATITVTVVDSNGNGVPGESVTITGDDGSSWSGTDDENGNYTFLVSSLDPMTVVYTSTNGELSSDTVSILYVGPTSSVTLTTSTSLSIIDQLVTLTFTANDINDNGVYGDTVNITGDDGSSYLATDNNDGTYTCDVTSSVAATVNYTGDDTTVEISSDPVQVVYNLPNMILLLKASDYSGSGTWNDQSTFGNNATIENGNISVNSAGNGIILDGSTSWTFPNIIAGSFWSANVWFKRTGSQTGPQACILTQITDDSSVNLTIGDINQNNNNTVSAGFMSDGVYETDNLQYPLTPLNLWINIQSTWDGANLITYINGVLVNSFLIGGIGTFFSASDSGLAYRIGNSWDSTNTTDYMIGEIGEVRIYNHAISSTEVLNDYVESLPTFYNIYTFIPSEKYFNTCSGLVYDSIGNLYVATYNDNKIYKINKSGYGILFTDFDIYNVIALHGITIDSNNNLYVCAANGNIYKVDIFGNIFIFNQGISFVNPWGICNDGSGNFFVTDYADGTITHVYNNGSESTTILSSLNNPQGIVYLNSALYFVNHEDGTVMNCQIDGSGDTILATLTSPTSLCGDQNSNLVVVDSNNTIYGINLTTNDISTLSSSSSINNPLEIIRNSLNNDFYISNNGDGSILKLSLGDSGIITNTYTAPGTNYVQTCVTDSSGNLYTSYNNGTVYQNSDLIANIGVTTIGCITIDFTGNLYVSGGRIIYKIESGTWTVTTYYTNSNTNTNYIGILWTQSGIYISDWFANNIRLIDNSSNETVIASGFNQPCDIKVGPNGNIYVSNFGSGIVSLINATTFTVTTFKSGFSSCVGIVFDCYGNLFMSDKTANNLYAIDQSGNNTLIASNLGAPNGIYYHNNTVYVCNNSNNKIATFSNYITPIPSIATLYFNADSYGGSNGITSQPNGALNVISNNYYIRKIDTNRVVSDPANIDTANGMCTDVMGNIYIGVNNSIYIFNPYDNINPYEYASGFSYVSGISITIDMTIMYVVDNVDNSLIKVTNDGTILNTVFSSLDNPLDVKLDSNNFIYVADNGNARILKINPTDYSYIIIGTNLIYTSPKSITFYNNNLIMSDDVTNNLYSIDSSGFSRLIMTNYSGYLTTDYKKNVFLANNNNSSIIEIPNVESQADQLVVLLEAYTYTNNNIWMDQSGNNNNSALNTGTLTLNEIGNGIILDGGSSLILNDLQLGNAWSIGIWYKNASTNFANDISIITQQLNNKTINAFIGGHNGNLTSGFVNNDNYEVSTQNITLTTDVWANIQITWDGTNLTTYFNNVLLGSTVLNNLSSSSGFSYIIGSDNYSGNYVNGEIGEFRAYNYALTSQQVATNYNTTYMTYLKTPFTILINTPITFNTFTFSISEQGNESIVPVLKAQYDSLDINLDNTGTFINLDDNTIPVMKSVQFIRDLVVNTNVYSITVVFSMNSDNNINGRIASFYNEGLNDYDNNHSIGIGYNDGSICLYYNNSTSTLITVNTDTYYILSYIIDNISGNVYTYLNGVLMATDNLNININTSLLAISGKLPVVLYPYALGNDDRQILEGYLASKWKLNSSLLANFQDNKNETLFTVKLGNWTSNVNITTLYLFDTVSSTLLSTISNFYGDDATGFYATFAYQFKQAQNYVTICTTDNLSTGILYVIAEPLIVTPPLILTLSSNDSLNNWGYYNIPMTKSFILSSYYYGNLVNYLDYYPTIKVYYADNNTFDNLTLTGNALLTYNNGVTTVNLTFTYNPDIMNTALYFYFTYSNLPSSVNTFVTNQYVFFDKTSLSFSLDHYNYYNNYTLYTNLPDNIALTGNNALFVYYSKDDPTYNNNNYENQTYITNVTDYNSNHGYIVINFPLPESTYYYMTISNRGPNIVRNSNDINVNIELPIYVNKVNIELNHYFGYYQNNSYIGTLGTYNGTKYSFPTIRIFYSTIIATQNTDLTELGSSPLVVTNNQINFDFDNSELSLQSVYLYFTADTSQIPSLDSFTKVLITFYDKYTLTFTLDHYDNSSPNYTITANNWTSILNTVSPLNIYILDSNKVNTENQPITVHINNDEDIWTGDFRFDFNNLDSGSYYITVSIINYTIPTPIIVTLAEPHFMLVNSQNMSYIISQPEPPVFFTPKQLPNISLWLDGYDLSNIVVSGTTNNIITWNDKSGLENNATAVNTPQLLPSYGILLDGISSYFTLPNNTLPTGNSIYSYFIVASFTENKNYSIISGGDNNKFELQMNKTTWNQNDLISNYTFTPNVPVLIESIYDGTNRFIYINNNLDSTDTPGTRSQSNCNNVLGLLMSGIIYEVVVYNNVLANPQRNRLETYLMNKWNMNKLSLSSPVSSTYSSNKIVTLTLSTYYPKVYLYYGTTSTSFSNLSVVNNSVTGNNIYSVNSADNSITFNVDYIDYVDINNIYFYASTRPNYTGVTGISMPFSYVDYSTINVSLDHYDTNTNVYNVNITGYNPLLLSQPLNVLAIQNNSSYINIDQTLTLLGNYSSQFTYSFTPYNIYNIVLCNSYDITNQPNGNIYYQMSNNIYSFTLNASLSNSDIYPGSNSLLLNFTIPGLPSKLCVANLITNGKILINNIPAITNPYNITVNQMNINMYKYQNNGFTIWLDAMDTSTLTYDENNNVSKWNDKSNLAYESTQTQTIYQPSYNSTNKSILFNQEFLNLPFTTFNNTNYYTCSFVFTHNGNDSYLMAKQHDSVNTYALGLFYGGGQYFRWQPKVGQNYDIYLGGFQQGVKYQMTFTYDGSNYRLWRNGQLYNTVSTTDGAIPNDLDVTTCTLGSWYSPDVGENSANIEIHEFIFNETYLYDNEIQKIESYLCNKWSIKNTSTNPYLNNMITFNPNAITSTDSIVFTTIDNVISIPNTLTGILVNPILTLNPDISTNYIITLDNWNSNITTVYLYGGTNSKYYDRTMLAQLSVTNDSNGYYIMVTINPLPDDNYYSIRDVNSDVFNFDLRVSNPNYSLKFKKMNNNIEISPSTCVLNKNNKIILSLPETLGKLYVYTCNTLYTTGKVGSGDRDLTFITIVNNSKEPEITINPTKLPIYILTSTEANYSGSYYQSNLISEPNLTLIKNSKINGIIDQENNFLVVLDNKYKNIQVNDSNIIIKHVINNNNIEFKYDPGFELNATFNIINGKSNEIYEIINVTFIDPKI